MKKKLSVIPTPCKDLWMDHVGGTVQFTQGQKSLFPTDPIATVGQVETMVLTISPMDTHYALVALNVSKPTGWTLGKSKGIVTSWHMKMQFHNPTNTHVRMKIYTLKLKKDMEYQPGVSATTSLRDLFELWFNNQYGNTATAIGIEYTSFRFQHLAEFTKAIKIVKIRSRTIQSGQTWTLNKYRKKPKLYNTATLYDPQNSPYIKKRGLRGDLHYMWEIEGHPFGFGASPGTTPSTFRQKINYLCSISMRLAYLANDTYSYDASTAMGSDPTGYVIMPSQDNVTTTPWVAAS